MKKNFFLKTVALAVMAPQFAFAYPIFFKCDANGRLSDQLTPPEISRKLTSMFEALRTSSAASRGRQIEELCQGGSLCMQELNQLLRLAEINGKITDELISAEMARIAAQAEAAATTLEGITPLPNGIFQSAVQYRDSIKSAALARECRVASTRLEADLMSDSNENCTLANFHHSPYMYASGIRYAGPPHEVQDQGKSSCAAIDDVITSALVADHDPYAAIALSLMEQGSTIEGLYLDPIGHVSALGCPATRGTASNNNLESYETYYNVSWGVRPNPTLLRNIANFAKVKNVQLQPGSSFACYNHDFQETTIVGTAIPNSCCNPIPYLVNSAENLEISQILTYSSFNNYLTAPLASNIRTSNPAENAARRLQRYNGYSDSMGGAEGVSAWRSGVNYFNTPAYGYQAMDFILNTLWNNPFVSQKVREAEERLGRQSHSVACQDHAAGTYTIDHNYYFNKHGASPRMTAIRERFAARGTWEGLPQRDRNVMEGENNAICDGSTSSQRFADYCAMSDGTARMRAYFRDVHPSRSTIADANGMDQGYQWRDTTPEQFTQLTGAVAQAAKDYYSEESDTYSQEDLEWLNSDLAYLQAELATLQAAPQPLTSEQTASKLDLESAIIQTQEQIQLAQNASQSQSQTQSQSEPQTQQPNEGNE